MEVLDITIVNVALRHIAGSLAASLDESTWIVTSYLVSNADRAADQRLAGQRDRPQALLHDLRRVSSPRASVMCAMSTSLSMMLIARVIQGIGGGGMAPTEQSIFADTFPLEKRAQAFALYGLTVVTAPAVGPILGGWLTDNLSWHWVLPDQSAGRAVVADFGATVRRGAGGTEARSQASAQRRSDDRLHRVRACRARFRRACRSCSTGIERDDGFASDFIVEHRC